MQQEPDSPTQWLRCPATALRLRLDSTDDTAFPHRHACARQFRIAVVSTRLRHASEMR